MSDRLKQVFAEELELDIEILSDDSSPDNLEAWDSLANMRLIIAIEEEFEIRLGTGDLIKMRSLGETRAVLLEKGVEL